MFFWITSANDTAIVATPVAVAVPDDTPELLLVDDAEWQPQHVQRFASMIFARVRFTMIQAQVAFYRLLDFIYPGRCVEGHNLYPAISDVEQHSLVVDLEIFYRLLYHISVHGIDVDFDGGDGRVLQDETSDPNWQRRIYAFKQWMHIIKAMSNRTGYEYSDAYYRKTFGSDPDYDPDGLDIGMVY